MSGSVARRLHPRDTINDFYLTTAEIDAINEPYEPIPSEAISLEQVRCQIWVLLLSGLAVAAGPRSLGRATRTPGVL